MGVGEAGGDEFDDPKLGWGQALPAMGWALALACRPTTRILLHKRARTGNLAASYTDVDSSVQVLGETHAELVGPVARVPFAVPGGHRYIHLHG